MASRTERRIASMLSGSLRAGARAFTLFDEEGGPVTCSLIPGKATAGEVAGLATAIYAASEQRGARKGPWRQTFTLSTTADKLTFDYEPARSTTMTFRMPADLKALAEAAAEAEGMTVADLIIRALEARCKQYKHA